MINWNRTARDKVEDQHCRGIEVEDNPWPYIKDEPICLDSHSCITQPGVVSVCSHYQYIARFLIELQWNKKTKCVCCVYVCVGGGVMVCVCVCAAIELWGEDIMSRQGKSPDTHCGWPHPHLYKMRQHKRCKAQCQNLTLHVILIFLSQCTIHNQLRSRQLCVCVRVCACLKERMQTESKWVGVAPRLLRTLSLDCPPVWCTHKH